MSSGIRRLHKWMNNDELKVVRRAYWSSCLEQRLGQHYWQSFSRFSDEPLETYLDFSLSLAGAYTQWPLQDGHQEAPNGARRDTILIDDDGGARGANSLAEEELINGAKVLHCANEGLIKMSGTTKRRLYAFSVFYSSIELLCLFQMMVGTFYESSRSLFFANLAAWGHRRSLYTVLTMGLFGISRALTGEFRALSCHKGTWKHLEPFVSARQSYRERRLIGFDLSQQARRIKSRIAIMMIILPMLSILGLALNLLVRLGYFDLYEPARAATNSTSATTTTTTTTTTTIGYPILDSLDIWLMGFLPSALYRVVASLIGSSANQEVVIKESSLFWTLIYSFWLPIGFARLYLYTFYFCVIAEAILSEFKVINRKLEDLAGKVARNQFDSVNNGWKPVKRQQEPRIELLARRQYNALLRLYAKHNELCEIVHNSDKFWSDILIYYWQGGLTISGGTLFYLCYVKVDLLTAFNMLFVTSTILSNIFIISRVSTRVSREASGCRDSLEYILLNMKMPQDASDYTMDFFESTKGFTIGFTAKGLGVRIMNLENYIWIINAFASMFLVYSELILIVIQRYNFKLGNLYFSRTPNGQPR